MASEHQPTGGGRADRDRGGDERDGVQPGDDLLWGGDAGLVVEDRSKTGDPEGDPDLPERVVDPGGTYADLTGKTLTIATASARLISARS